MSCKKTFVWFMLFSFLFSTIPMMSPNVIALPNNPTMGYELLDNGEIFHMWNKFNDYYFNTSSGIQITNHYQQWWTHNVMLLGYYQGDEWHVLYRTDELTGFTWSIDTDNTNYINVTGYRDLTYSSYNFRLAVRYSLFDSSQDLTVIPYIKNLGIPIPYTLAFGWEIKDIKIGTTYENDQIRINGTSYLLNQALNKKYTNIGNDTIFHLDDLDERGIIAKTLYLRWNHTLGYLVWVKSRTGQYNAPVTLFIRIGTLASGQEKYTKMYWWDSSYEDFTTFTEVDPDNRWTETTTRCTATGADRDESDYVYKDYGVGYFGSSWEHGFTIKITSSGTQGIVVLYMQANALNSWINQTNAIGLYFYDDVGSPMTISLKDRTGASDTYTNLLHDGSKVYYMTLNRSGTTLTLYIYNDESRTDLEDTLSITMVDLNYRYLYAGSTWNTSDYGYPMSGYIENLLITGPIPNFKPQFANESIYPSSGFEILTTFTFNVSYFDTEDGNPNGVYCVIAKGSNIASNQTMTYIGGNNYTGANYTFSRTLPVGAYNYYFYAFDGLNWNISDINYFNVTSNSSFSVNFPVFLEVGQYIMSWGALKNTTGHPISGIWAHTKILDSATWATVPYSSLDYYVVDGAYMYSFSTSSMLPGIYHIIVNYTYLGSDFLTNWTLYLSDYTGPGHYATDIYFTFYSSNTGIGIEPLSFKIYCSDSATLTASDRIYGNAYHNTYTGQTLYYRVDDYFDNQVYPLIGSYSTALVTRINQFIDVPISWYDLAIKNLNETIMYFSMSSGARSYSITLFPMDSIHINVLPGNYNIVKLFYSAYNGSLLETKYDTISITSDAFYISTGYNAVVHISWYNTNEGLGLPEEILKLYIDGVRQISKTYYSYINQTINVTVKDYYNLTLYTGNFTLTNTYTFLDFGLTFHSYKFSNLNNKYYMISFLRDGGSRWFERGICPYETVEFLLPSGNYSLRIYDSLNVTLYDNSSIKMVNSKLYVLNGSALELVINGQSVIVGQLLELRSELGYATMPNIQNVITNAPYIYSVFDPRGAIIGTERICPALVVTATTTNETTTNCTMYPLIPKTTINNGTIRVKDDRIYFSGSSNWVNVSTLSGTLIQNTSYVPNCIELTGQNITIKSAQSITVKRETTYQQQKKFYWTKYTDTRYYIATVTISNPLNTTIRHVYIYIELDNGTTPDISTAKCYDVSNNVYLTSGTNFRVSNGIEFYLDSISALGSRQFTCSYYGLSTAQVPSDAITIVNDYDLKMYDNKNYWHLSAQWVNTGSATFIGSLNIQFNFDTDYTDANGNIIHQIISPRSFVVYDRENSRYLDRDEFVYLGNGLQICQATMGTVNPNSARAFDVYFLFVEAEDQADVPAQAKSWLKTSFWGQIEYFHVLMVILGIVALASFDMAYGKKRSAKTFKKEAWVGFIVCLIMFILFIWYTKL